MIKTVSVHIVMYNSADDIEECLNGVLEQSHPIEQIVIIDNASSDDSVERVISFSEQFGSKVIMMKNAINIGFAPAQNQAIELTNSDYVLVLNPDVKLDGLYVEQLVEYMERHPKVGSGTGKLVHKSSPETVDSTGLVMNGIWRAFDRGTGEQASAYMKSGEVFGVSGAAALYARRMIEDISIQGEFFDGDFFAYKEDVDVAWRAGKLGWKAYYCAEAIGMHERGWKKGDRKSRPLFIRRVSYINRYKMIYKNLTGLEWLTNVPMLLAYEVATHGYILLREPRVLGAWIDFWRQLPELRRKRQEIRKKR